MDRKTENVKIITGVVFILLITIQLLNAQFHGYILNLLNVVTVPAFFFTVGYNLDVSKTRRQTILNSMKKYLLPYVLVSLVFIILNKLFQLINKPELFVSPFSSMTAGLKTFAYGIIWPTNTLFGNSDFGVGLIWLLLGMFFAIIIFSICVYRLSKTWQQIIVVITFTLFGYILNQFVQLPWSFEAACVVQPYIYFGYQFKNHEQWRMEFSTFLVGIILWFALSRTGSFDFGVANIPHWILGTVGSLFSIACLYYFSDKVLIKVPVLRELISYLGKHYRKGIISIAFINEFLQVKNYLSFLITNEDIILILTIMLTSIVLMCLYIIYDHFINKKVAN